MTIADPKPPGRQADLDKAADLPEDADQWTAKLRHTAVEALPPQRLLPDRQPAYVASWIYVFGVITLAAWSWSSLTGLVLAILGPTWWHVSTIGLFVNSLHLWSVEVFFFAMVVHLWGKFFMAAWRGQAQGHLDHRRGLLPGVGRGRLHRLPVPAELRLPVDQHPGQGRHQLDRGRSHLQRHQLRPDAHVAHRAAAPVRGRAGRRARPAGPAAGRRAAVRRPKDETAQARGRLRPTTGSEVQAMSAEVDQERTGQAPKFNPDRDVHEWHGSYVPYDLVKEFLVALRGRASWSSGWPCSSRRPTTSR